jgi:hypothetical protein
MSVGLVQVLELGQQRRHGSLAQRSTVSLASLTHPGRHACPPQGRCSRDCSQGTSRRAHRSTEDPWQWRGVESGRFSRQGVSGPLTLGQGAPFVMRWRASGSESTRPALLSATGKDLYARCGTAHLRAAGQSEGEWTLSTLKVTDTEGRLLVSSCCPENCPGRGS